MHGKELSPLQLRPLVQREMDALGLTPEEGRAVREILNVCHAMQDANAASGTDGIRVTPPATLLTGTRRILSEFFGRRGEEFQRGLWQKLYQSRSAVAQAALAVLNMVSFVPKLQQYMPSFQEELSKKYLHAIRKWGVPEKACAALRRVFPFMMFREPDRKSIEFVFSKDLPVDAILTAYELMKEVDASVLDSLAERGKVPHDLIKLFRDLKDPCSAIDQKALVPVLGLDGEEYLRVMDAAARRLRPETLRAGIYAKVIGLSRYSLGLPSSLEAKPLQALVKGCALSFELDHECCSSLHELMRFCSSSTQIPAPSDQEAFRQLKFVAIDPEGFAFAESFGKKCQEASVALYRHLERSLSLPDWSGGDQGAWSDDRHIREALGAACLVISTLGAGIREKYSSVQRGVHVVASDIIAQSVFDALFHSFLHRRFPRLFPSFLENERHPLESKRMEEQALEQQRDTVHLVMRLLGELCDRSQQDPFLRDIGARTCLSRCREGFNALLPHLYLQYLRKPPKQTPDVRKVTVDRPIPAMHSMYFLWKKDDLSGDPDTSGVSYVPSAISPLTVTRAEPRQGGSKTSLFFPHLQSFPCHSPFICIPLAEIFGENSPIASMAAVVANQGRRQLNNWLNLCQSHALQHRCWPCLERQGKTEPLHLLSFIMKNKEGEQANYFSLFALPRDIAASFLDVRSYDDLTKTGSEEDLLPALVSKFSALASGNMRTWIMQLCEKGGSPLPADAVFFCPEFSEDLEEAEGIDASAETSPEELERLKKYLSDDGRKRLWSLKDAKAFLGKFGIIIEGKKGRSEHPKVRLGNVEHSIYPEALKQEKIYAQYLSELLVYFGLVKDALRSFEEEEQKRRKKRNGNGKSTEGR